MSHLQGYEHARPSCAPHLVTDAKREKQRSLCNRNHLLDAGTGEEKASAPILDEEKQVPSDHVHVSSNVLCKRKLDEDKSAHEKAKTKTRERGCESGGESLWKAEAETQRKKQNKQKRGERRIESSDMNTYLGCTVRMLKTAKMWVVGQIFTVKGIRGRSLMVGDNGLTLPMCLVGEQWELFDTP